MQWVIYLYGLFQYSLSVINNGKSAEVVFNLSIFIVVNPEFIKDYGEVPRGDTNRQTFIKREEAPESDDPAYCSPNKNEKDANMADHGPQSAYGPLCSKHGDAAMIFFKPAFIFPSLQGRFYFPSCIFHITLKRN